MASRIGIFNKAISRIKAKAIASADENSLEARECRRHYPDIIAEMLTGPHDWSFQNRRAVLAEISNSRTSEWAFAYALPADMGTPIRVLPDFEGLGLTLPVPIPGEPYAEAWAFTAGYDVPYIIENGVLYTNAASATLEYGISSIEDAAIAPLVERAVVTDLASRIAKPVKDNDKLAKELASEAELHWQRAMSDDENRHPRMSGQYVSESMAARSGYLGTG